MSTSASACSATRINDFSLSGHFTGMRFPKSGTVAVIASAKDTPGSVTEAFEGIAITKSAVPPSNDVLLEVLDEAAASGEPFATLVAIDAVASTSASYDAKFSGKL